MLRQICPQWAENIVQATRRGPLGGEDGVTDCSDSPRVCEKCGFSYSDNMLRKRRELLSGWGHFPKAQCFVERPEHYSELRFEDEGFIPRGLGRSYGDAAINSERIVLLMERLDRFLSFDRNTGILRAEAGLSLEKLLEVIVPKGWFLPVTPGTKLATLGGCVACDVHGKNHHVDGSFGSFVREMELILPDHSKCLSSPKKDADLFWATLGGMGLTGIISEVSLQLIPIETAYMNVQYRAAKDLDEGIELLSRDEDRYSVAWIDCLHGSGRSIVMNGHHASLQELPKKIKSPCQIPSRKRFSLPFNCPSWFLNSYFIKAFNAVYYWIQSQKTTPFIIDYDHYFYPLDSIGHWNRFYGKRGFIQYQFVIPTKNAAASLRSILAKLSKARCGSFLGVLKRFGKEGNGFLSFPLEGFTLALDIPLGYPGLFSLLDELDMEIIQSGGREYLAKDSRMSPESFRLMYPRFSNWLKIKRQVDPKSLLSSDLSRRLRMESL